MPGTISPTIENRQRHRWIARGRFKPIRDAFIKQRTIFTRGERGERSMRENEPRTGAEEKNMYVLRVVRENNPTTE